MASGSIKTVKSGIQQKLEAMIKRGRTPESFLTHVAYPMYLVHQHRRWMTEGKSEGRNWMPLSIKYAEWKRRHFAGFPGHGTKMLIASGKLFGAVTGRDLKGDPTEITYENAGGKIKPVLSGGLGEKGSPYHQVRITSKQLHVFTNLDYAPQVNAARNFWYFSPEFYKRVKAAYRGWFATGSVRSELANRGRS